MMTQHLKTFAQNVLPNTFIGGVATTINTPSMLASTIGVAESKIKAFKIVGNNIQCLIDGSYNIQANAFTSNQLRQSITYYNDVDGLVRVIGTSAFQGLWTNPLSNTLLWLNFPKAESINGTFVSYASNANNISTPNLKYIYGQYNYNKTNTSELILDNVLEVVGSCALGHDSNNVGNEALISLKKCKILNNLVSVTSTNYIFRNIKMGAEIRINEYLKTNNSGQSDLNLVMVKQQRQAIVKFYDDNGNYVSTL